MAVRAYDQVDLGQILTAGFAKDVPDFAGSDRLRGVRRAGQIYEAHGQAHFEKLFPETYLRAPWLLFRTHDMPRWQYCQPDGLLFLPDKLAIVIVEFKLRHTADAYWQVQNLYQPVLEKILVEGWHFRRLEVTKWYDPDIYFPIDPTLVEDPALTPRKGMGVHIWKK